MGQRTGAELDDRVAALSARIDKALACAKVWISPAHRPETEAGASAAELARLEAALERAEANVTLQAQRCLALEDRVVELEAALVGARDARARVEAIAEHARDEADHALDQLELARGESSDPADASLAATLQQKLLEVERLTVERDSLRSASADWQAKARQHRRERDESTQALSRTTAELERLRDDDEAAQRKLRELERRVAEQARELELAKRRTEHLRQHIGSSS